MSSTVPQPPGPLHHPRHREAEVEVEVEVEAEAGDAAGCHPEGMEGAATTMKHQDETPGSRGRQTMVGKHAIHPLALFLGFALDADSICKTKNTVQSESGGTDLPTP